MFWSLIPGEALTQACWAALYSRSLKTTHDEAPLAEGAQAQVSVAEKIKTSGASPALLRTQPRSESLIERLFGPQLDINISKQKIGKRLHLRHCNAAYVF